MIPNAESSPPARPAPAVAEAARAFNFAAGRLPWLAGGLLLAVYGFTLNHWVAPASLKLVSNLQDLVWKPMLTEPVTFLLTYPFRWLPAAWIPLALNGFSAVCAVLSLVWLARCVALLPHNLTREADPAPPKLVFRPPALMTSRSAWLPPLLAVLVLGLQFSFWQGALAGSGEMLNLLMFAGVIRCLLEYNASGRNAWLLWGALVSGLGVANDWAMMLFLPAMILALIWVKRLFLFNEFYLKQLLRRPDAFRLGLLWQIPVCWLAGASLILLLPALAALSRLPQLGFWTALHLTLHAYRASLAPFSGHLLTAICLVSTAPVFLVSFSFYHFLTSRNRLHYFIGAVFFQLVLGFLLGFCLWTMFDSPLSPRQLGLGLASLPLYFLAALTVGHLTGHFLLTAKITPGPDRSRRQLSPLELREAQINQLSRLLKRIAVAALAVLAAGVPAVLFWQNLPEISRSQSEPCGGYFQQLVQNLPPKGAVLLDNDPYRLFYLQSALIRSGRAADYLVLDRDAVEGNPHYLEFLKRRHPQFDLELKPSAPGAAAVAPPVLLTLLDQLAAKHEIYCLTPAPIGDAVAAFYFFEPHQLFCRMVRCRENQEFAGPLPPDLLRDNELFWRAFEAHPMPEILHRLTPPRPARGAGLLGRFLVTLRFAPAVDVEALRAGVYYATALNDWGVTLQRTGKFPPAGHYFASALQLNPYNAAATINQKFNTDYQARQAGPAQKPEETAATLNEYRDWRHVLPDGAVDEPNFCFMLGTFMHENHLFRPAIAQFQRAVELAPDRADVQLSLGRVLLEIGDARNTLIAANVALALAPTNQVGLLLKAGACLQLQFYADAIPLLTQLLTLDPNDQISRLNRGIAYRKCGDFADARKDYQAVLQAEANTYAAYYDLAEMARAEHKPAEATANYELFLKYAPPNFKEVAWAKAHLQELKSAAP